MEQIIPKFIDVNEHNISEEHLCCIIRKRKPHQGIEAKKRWLIDRFQEGHVFRKLNVEGIAFIEYAPLETAWVPIQGERYLYIYCLWVNGNLKGKGYGKLLMQSCIRDAMEKGLSGICLLGAKKQKAWLTDQAFAKSFGFEVVDTTTYGYDLLALSFDGNKPKFMPTVKDHKVEYQDLSVYYSMQCPYICQNIEIIKKYCEEKQLPYHLIPIDSVTKAKQLPFVFHNWAVCYQGKFITVNLLLDTKYLDRLFAR